MKKPNQRILGKTKLKVFPIGLGTVEIGLPYGIKVGTLPTTNKVQDLLQKVSTLGINFVDTARSYGVAEERIGKSELINNPNIIIATKCAAFLGRGDNPTKEVLRKKIYSDVDLSLKFLNLKTLPLLQFHGGSAEQINQGNLIKIAQDLKKENKIKYIGISTRDTSASLAAINCGIFDTIQVAYNILDQREAKEVLPLAQKKKIGVVVRSVFLKGALIPAVSSLPSELSTLKKHSKLAHQIANKLNISLPTLAMQFVLSNPAVSVALVGTYKQDELQVAIDAALAGPLPEEVLMKLKLLAINDVRQIDPFYWPSVKD